MFEAVREGVFMGAIAPPGVHAADSTLAANPHLKLILGYPLDTPETDVAPFARGINSIQLVEQDGRWWVVSILWQDERFGDAVPPQYLPHA